MANRSYLCVTSQNTTYPSARQPGFNPQQQVIASDTWCVPLLWPALFRPADIVRWVVPGDGQDMTDAADPDDDLVTEAPITTRTRAIEQLRAAMPYFTRLFGDGGGLDAYASFLVSALEAAPYELVTIEMDEIASLSDPKQSFHDGFRAVLGAIGVDASDGARRRLVELASLRDGRRLPPARLLLDHLPAHEDDFWNHTHVLGAGAKEAGIGRAVPWELAPLSTRFTAATPALVPVFMPRLEIVLRQHEERKGAPLTKEEVIAIRDRAVCLMVPAADAAKLPTSNDIDPADCWEAWLARRTPRV